MPTVTIEEVKRRAENDAKNHGYYLHSDPEILQDLLEGLKINEERYGYPSCPCRLATGDFEFDRDIICPCDYRDPDIHEYGACYCTLYVRKDLFEDLHNVPRIPERRPITKQTRYVISEEHNHQNPEPNSVNINTSMKSSETPLSLWYCKQCGYVAFREDAPYICPICKAKKYMFKKIAVGLTFLAR